MKRLELLLALMILGVACTQTLPENKLPVLGRTQLVERIENGKVFYDTLPHTVKNFAFVNQDSVIVTNQTFDNQVYVADFFFTTCPTICPKMKKEMLRVYSEYETNPEVGILSHTIDPTHDTVAVLRDFAERLGVSSDKWHFVTGDQDAIYDISESSYMVTAASDPNEPGGYIHSGAFLLVDKERRIRGVYDGTVPEQVDLLIKDIDKLLKETQG
ncbi:MAG: SCO family protein [Cyclobacteriaceae bacterium]